MNEQTDNQQWIEPCPGWVMWQATNSYGNVFGYARKPEPARDGSQSYILYPIIKEDRDLLATVPPPADWRETLVARPAKGQPWIDWTGGQCPVPGETIVELRYRGGGRVFRSKAEHCRWNHEGPQNEFDIIAYRIVSPAPASAEQPDAADREWDKETQEWYEKLEAEYGRVLFHLKLKREGEVSIDEQCLRLARGREQAAAELAQVRAELERATLSRDVAKHAWNHAQNQRDAALAQVEKLRRALKEIRDLSERQYEKFPDDWQEQIANCSECQRYKDHPIQQGICDRHRQPLWARERHNRHEEQALGPRCQAIARAALQPEEMP